MKSRAKLHIVAPNEPTERVYGSPGFIARDRNPALPQPQRFEPTVKKSGDIII